MRVIQESFAGGEMSPEMFGRVSDARVRSGAAVMRNAIPLLQGAVRRRPGTEFVAFTKNNGPAHLIPFEFSADQSMVVEAGLGYMRFHTDGQTLLHGEAERYFPSSRVVADPGTDVLQVVRTEVSSVITPAVHELPNGRKVRFTSTGTLPTGLQPNTDYYLRDVTPTSFKVAETPTGSAVNIGSAGSTGAVHTMHVVYTVGDLIDRRGEVSFDGSNNYVNCTAPHGLQTNDQVRFEVGVPGGLQIGVTYFVRDVVPQAFRVAATPGGAAIPLVSTATGRWKFGTLGASSFFYCIQEHTNELPPLFLFWYRQPASGVYEIPTPYDDEEKLFQLSWDGSLDVVTLTHRDYQARDLRREAPTRWVLQPIAFAPKLTPPTISGVTVDKGQSLFPAGIAFTTVSTVLGSARAVRFQFIGDHGLAPGDTVFLSDGRYGDGMTTNNPAAEVPMVQNTHYFVTFIPDPKEVMLTSADGRWVTSLAVNPSPPPLIVDSFTVTGTPRLRLANLTDEVEHVYVATAVDANGVESLPSAEASAVNTLTVNGGKNTLTITPVAGAEKYRVYKKLTGVFGLIGEARPDGGTITFEDRDETPDLEFTPPILDDALTLENPGAVARFQERRVFGGLKSRPSDLLATRTGTESDFTRHLPLLEDDRISARLTSRVVNEIRHIVPMDQLLVLTSAAEFRITPINDDALTPLSVSARAQSYVGCNYVRPLTVNNTVVFCAARGGHVRELGFVADANGWVSGDLSLRAAHLFDDYDLRASARSVAPTPVLWFVSTSGRLLGMTHAPEEQIGGWHWHDTDGAFRSVAVAQEGDEDRVYVVAERTIGGQQVHVIERLGEHRIETIDDYLGTDCSSVYSGAPTTSFALPHLIGKTVDVRADGAVHRFTVPASGTITLPKAASRISGGLPFLMQLQTMPLAMNVEAAAQGRTKNLLRAWVQVFESAAFSLGPTLDLLVRAKTLPETSIASGEVRTTLERTWTDRGQLWITQDLPLPLMVLSLVMETGVGG